MADWRRVRGQCCVNAVRQRPERELDLQAGAVRALLTLLTLLALPVRLAGDLDSSDLDGLVLDPEALLTMPRRGHQTGCPFRRSVT